MICQEGSGACQHPNNIYIYIRLKTKKKIWFNCLRDVNVSENLDSSSRKQMI